MGEIRIPRTVAIVLGVCTTLLISAVFIYIGVTIGQWGEYEQGREDEAQAQEWAETHFVQKKNPDGSTTIRNGRQIITIGRTVTLDAEIQTVPGHEDLERELELQLRYDKDSAGSHTQSLEQSGSEQSSSQWGRKQTITVPPRR